MGLASQNSSFLSDLEASEAERKSFKHHVAVNKRTLQGPNGRLKVLIRVLNRPESCI